MDPTLAWARSLLRRYYRRNAVLLPPRYGRREYGFLFLGKKGMQRHTGFATRGDIGEFMAERGPAHAYYSAAYYEQPDATDMDDKVWMGADLIFDLDADHLPGADEMSYAGMLEEVRQEAIKVAEEFMIGHFGFTEDDLKIAFSGGRGYHIHVMDPSVHPLGSQERREIVDYVTGNGLAIERLLRQEIYASEQVGTRSSEKKRWSVPAAQAPGWEGLFTRTLVGQLEAIAHKAKEDREAALDELTSIPGIGDTKAERLLDELARERLAGLAKGNVGQVPTLSDRRVLQGLAERTHHEAIGEADEPVTADTHRLIRLPGSLHGKTALRVTPLTLSELKAFDPLEDAVALGDQPVSIELKKPQEVTLAGQRYELEEGVHEVPEHVAAFVVFPFAGGGPPWRPTLATQEVSA